MSYSMFLQLFIMSSLIRSVFPGGAVAVAHGPGSVATATSNGAGSYAEATAIGPGARANACANEGQSHVVANIIDNDGNNQYWNYLWPFGWSPFSFMRGNGNPPTNPPPPPRQ